MLNRSDVLAKPEVKEAVSQIRDALRKALPGATFGEREAEALAISNEAVRELLQEDLQAMSDSFGDEVVVDGVPYKEHAPGTDTYHSLCGPLHVNRPSFRQTGVHNGPIVIALELAAGLVEGATPALAYNLAHGYAQHDMRTHGETLDAAHRLAPSRTTLERIATRIAQNAVEQSTRIEPIVRRAERVPDDAVAISIGLDRTSAPMIEDRPEDAPPKPEPKRRRPRIRRAPAPYDINWRMAYVGTVCFVDANGETLRTVRYASAACDDPRELVSRMTADLSAALKKRTDLTVGIVQDGAPEMWNRTREGLQALRDEGRLETWHEAIDRYHLMERLGEALKIVESNATDEQRKQHLAHWRATCSTPPRTLSIASNSSCDSAATASRTIGIRRLFERIGSTSRTTRTDCDTSRFARPASPSAVASPRAPPRPSSINVPRAPDNAGEKSDSVVSSLCALSIKANVSPDSGHTSPRLHRQRSGGRGGMKS